MIRTFSSRLKALVDSAIENRRRFESAPDTGFIGIEDKELFSNITRKISQ